ncbi:MAG: ROK family protein, partial [Planctomycetota bacterium]
RILNDANAAAFAEHATRGFDNESLALVTLGTGVGCGLVIAGSPCGGDHGCAGELGHIAVDFSDQALPCTCGSRGHLETYAGAAGVMSRLRTRLELSDARSSLRDPDATPRDLADAANSGCSISLGVIDETAEYLGRAIGMLAQCVDPKCVVIGGAMNFGGDELPAGARFLKAIRESVRATTLVQVGGNLEVEFARQGPQAGRLGAALVAQQLSQVSANIRNSGESRNAN